MQIRPIKNIQQSQPGTATCWSPHGKNLILADWVMNRILILACLVLLLATPARAQTTVTDPTRASLEALARNTTTLTLKASKTQSIPLGLEILFPFVQTLTLSGPFSGPLPTSWSAWSDIVRLIITSTRVTGPVPREYASWGKTFKELRADGTLLSGSLSSDLKAWVNLEVFDVGIPPSAQRTEPEGGNGISGTLPREYASWTKITSFSVRNTMVSGTLPPEYESMRGVKFFSFRGASEISGTLPANYSKWANITEFYAFGTALSGTLPPEYVTWVKIFGFQIHLTAISGTLPPSYGAWTKCCIRFYAHANLLSGTLPPEYGAWTTIGDFRVYDTRIAGTLPGDYGAWRNVTIVSIYNTLISGTLPREYASWNSIDEFSVDNTSLSGTLPPEYASWPAVRKFTFDNTKINGTLPVQYARWKSIISFSASRTLISGTIPAEFVSWTQLVEFFMNPSLLHGLIPSFGQKTMATLSLMNMTITDRNFSALEFFNCDQCTMKTDLFPNATVISLRSAQVSKLPYASPFSRAQVVVMDDCAAPLTVSESWTSGSLELLSLKRCGMTKPLLALLDSDVDLFLTGNLMTGTLPSLNRVSLRRTIDVSFNHLSGAVPDSWLLDMPHLQQLDIAYNQLTRGLSQSWSTHKTLTYISFSGNAIGDLGGLPRTLKQLHASGCSISVPVSDFLNSTTALEIAILNHNELLYLPEDLSQNITIFDYSANPMVIGQPIPQLKKHLSLAYIDITPRTLSNEHLQLYFLHPDVKQMTRFSAHNPVAFQYSFTKNTFGVLDSPFAPYGYRLTLPAAFLLMNASGKSRYYCILHPTWCPPVLSLNSQLILLEPQSCDPYCKSLVPRLRFPPHVTSAGISPRLALTFETRITAGSMLCECTGLKSMMWVNQVNESKQYVLHVSPEPEKKSHWNHLAFSYSILPAQYLLLEDMTGTFFHGIPCNLTIELEGYANLTYTNLLREGCPSFQTAIRGSALCASCPRMGTCNGSIFIVTKENAWRPSEMQSTFLICDDSVNSCRTGAERVGFECANGYAGILCSTCTPNFGRVGQFCEECDTTSELALFSVAMMVLGILGFYAAMSYLACQNAEIRQVESDRRESMAARFVMQLKIYTLPIKRIVKIAITLLFCMGTLFRTRRAERLTAVTRGILRAYGAVATLSPVATASFTCLVDDAIYVNFLMFTIGILPMVLAVIALVFAAGLLRPTDRKRWPISAGTCLVCVSTLMYPQTMVSVINLLNCDTLEFSNFSGNMTTFHALAEDRSISCDDESYTTYRNAAWGAGIAFGAGFPMFTVAFGAFFKTEAFAYLTDGLHRRAWWWELLTMFRKSALLVAVSVIKHESTQIDVFIVINYFFVMAAIIAKPYNGSEIYNWLEVLSTSATVIVAMLLTVLADYQSPEATESLSIVIAMLCLLSAAAVILCCVKVLHTVSTTGERKASSAKDAPPVENPPRVDAVLHPPNETKIVVDPVVNHPYSLEYARVLRGGYVTGRAFLKKPRVLARDPDTTMRPVVETPEPAQEAPREIAYEFEEGISVDALGDKVDGGAFDYNAWLRMQGMEQERHDTQTYEERARPIDFDDKAPRTTWVDERRATGGGKPTVSN